MVSVDTEAAHREQEELKSWGISQEDHEEVDEDVKDVVDEIADGAEKCVHVCLEGDKKVWVLWSCLSVL